MISRENYKEAHIRELQASSKGDPGLIERSNFEIIGNTDIRSEALSQADLKTMKNFKKIRTDGYGYLILADKLLSEYRNNQ